MGIRRRTPVQHRHGLFERDERVVFTSAWGMADTVSNALGVVPLALAYAATLALLYINHRQRLNFFAPAGRMALTTYLSQTLLGIFLFYNVGLGFGQQFGLSWLFCLVIAIYTLQALFSRWWLQRFEYGPVEWLWRQLTYGKRLTIRRKKNVEKWEINPGILTPVTETSLP